MSKVKPFNRETAKITLENSITDYVKKHYHDESEKAKHNNDSQIFTDDEQNFFKEFLKNIETIIKHLQTILNKILDLKLSSRTRQKYIQIFSNYLKICETLKNTDKQLPVKINKWIIHEVSTNDSLLVNIIGSLSKSFSGFCGGSKQKKTLDSQINKVEEIIYFWEGLTNCEAREGFEKYIVLEFRENEFRKILKNAIEKNYPPEEKPQIIKEEKIHYKYVDKPVTVADNVRLAHELLYGIGRPQEISQALTIYYEEVEKNHNIFALNTLGQLHYEGIFVPKDLNKSYSFYQKSADQKDGEGFYRIGLLYEQNFLSENEEISDSQLEKAVDNFKKAAEQEHLDALTDLGYYFYYGLKSKNGKNFILKPDIESSIKYYKIAKRKRFPRALNNLGRLYIENPSYEEKFSGDNLRKGIKYLEIASELGNVKALHNLGVCYLEGKGVNINHEKARSLFKEAALKGDISSKLSYGVELLREASYSDNEDLYVDAALLFKEVLSFPPKKPEACYYLGYLYENGFGVDKDYKTSLKYYNISAQLNYAPAYNKLGDYFHSGVGVNKKDIDKAIQYYEYGAIQNNTESMINLGTIYENNYSKKNIDEAFKYYKNAAKNGNPRGNLNLGYLYDNFKKDPNQALHYYEQAALKGSEIAKNLIASKGKTFLNENSSILSNINVQGTMLNDDKQSLFESDIKNKKQNNTLPLISSFMSSGMPKRFVKKQIDMERNGFSIEKTSKKEEKIEENKGIKSGSGKKRISKENLRN